MQDSKNEILTTNEGIDKKVVEEFEKLKKQLLATEPFDKGAGYSLDIPFANTQGGQQPPISQVIKSNKKAVG